MILEPPTRRPRAPGEASARDASGSFHADYSAWPLAQFVMLGKLSDAEHQRSLAEYSTLLAGGRRHACLLDLTHASPPPASHLTGQLRWHQENRKLIERQVVGMAFVVHSRLLRGLLSSMFTIQPWLPYGVFPSHTMATRWARRRLERQGVLNTKGHPMADAG